MQNRTEYQKAVDLKQFCRTHVGSCENCVFYHRPEFFGEKSCTVDYPSQWRIKANHIREPTKKVQHYKETSYL